MSDRIYTHVTGSPYLVYAGQGDVHLHVDHLNRGETKDPQEQAADELLWLQQRFIYPENFGKARAILADHRTVFLDGLPGSGRTAAAKMLLWELRQSSGRFHGLGLQEREEGPRIDRSHIGEGDQIWLNLSKLELSEWAGIHAELSTLRARVQERHAYLVVILPHGPAYDLRSELTPYHVTLGEPSREEALRRYLDVAAIPYSEVDPATPFLDTKPTFENIPRYVGLIAQARDKADGTGDFATWCAAANQAWTERQGEVAARVAELGGAQRALLIAVAMLHGAHADGVHHAAEMLLRTMEHPPDERPMLNRTALDRRLAEIHAKRDTAGRVWFDHLAYDSTVRSYVWAHMPELHKGISDWVRASLDSAELAESERRGMVQAYAELCLNDRHWPALIALVTEWGASPTKLHREVAGDVLTMGVLSERWGRYFRRQVYDWSTKGDFSEEFVELCVAVCRGPMAVSHPNEAVVRLHHFARRFRTSNARAALLDVVRTDRHMFRFMLDRLTNPDRRQRDLDVDLFLDLVALPTLTEQGTLNHALIAERGVSRQLQDGWHRVFAEKEQNEWQKAAQEWLTLAAEDPGHRDALLDILVSAANGRMSILAGLYRMALRPSLMDTLAGFVLEKINHAQDLNYAARP